MTKRFGVLAHVFSFVILALSFAHDAVGAARQKHASTGKDAGHATPQRHEQASAKPKSSKSARRTTDKGGKPQVGDSGRTAQIPMPRPRPAPPPAGDLGALKQAIELIRIGKTSEATALENVLDDKVGQTLIEWFVLRHPNGVASFRRYAAFIDANPDWPSMRQLRRRAEGRLWQEKIDGATVHRFTAGQPVSGAGRLVLARTLLNEGDRDGAAREAREAWRSQELSERIEGEALELFGDLLVREDHLARMDKRIGAKDLRGASRAAARVGSDGNAIIKACAAVASNDKKAPSLLDAVPGQARQDLG